MSKLCDRCDCPVPGWQPYCWTCLQIVLLKHVYFDEWEAIETKRKEKQMKKKQTIKAGQTRKSKGIGFVYVIVGKTLQRKRWVAEHTCGGGIELRDESQILEDTLLKDEHGNSVEPPWPLKSVAATLDGEIRCPRCKEWLRLSSLTTLVTVDA